jgi:Flp pilus assembly pilin Flp
MIHSHYLSAALFAPQRARSRQRGQGLTEYLILMVLISLVSIAAVKSLGGTIQRKLQMAREHINQVSPHGDDR